MSIDVSVIIPIYNAEKNIRACVESVTAQTLKNIEIILVDDGSTDATPRILDDIAKLDPRIRVIHQVNCGAGAARNNGLKYAVGEYLSILDADDFFEPDMLELSYQKAKETDADIVVFSCDMYDDETKHFRPCDYSIRRYLLPEQEPFSAMDVKKDVFKLFVGWAWDKLIRTEFVRENNFTFQEQRTTNDMLFVFSAIMRAQRIVTMKDVLVHYRRGEGSLSVTREKSWTCFYNALTSLKENLVNWGIYERFEQDFINYVVNFSLWNLNTLAEPTHTLLLEKLRDEWFDEMNVIGHPAKYFYNQTEYRQVLSILATKQEPHIEGEPYRETRGNIFLRGFTCLKDNGLHYTIQNIRKKIAKKLGGHRQGL